MSVLLGSRSDQNLFDVAASIRATRPEVRIIVTGSGTDVETILKALACGAKGYVDEAAPSGEFRAGHPRRNQGFVWAPRKVLRCSSNVSAAVR